MCISFPLFECISVFLSFCEDSHETLHSGGSDSGVLVLLWGSVCAPVPVCFCAEVNDLCIGSFSLPLSLHRGCSSPCQTEEHCIILSHQTLLYNLGKRFLFFLTLYSTGMCLFFDEVGPQPGQFLEAVVRGRMD